MLDGGLNVSSSVRRPESRNTNNVARSPSKSWVFPSMKGIRMELGALLAAAGVFLAGCASEPQNQPKVPTTAANSTDIVNPWEVPQTKKIVEPWPEKDKSKNKEQPKETKKTNGPKPPVPDPWAKPEVKLPYGENQDGSEGFQIPQ